MIQVTENFTYQESQYDGVAQIDSVKGNTVVFNQHIQNGDFVSTSNWGLTRVTLSVSGNVGTCKITEVGTASYSNNIASYGVNIPKGHHVLVVCDYMPKHTHPFFVFLINSSGNPFISKNATENVWNRMVYDFTPDRITSDVASIQFAFNALSQFGYAVNDEDKIKNCMVIDLTQLADSRVTDYDSFIKYYPLPYYSYTQGELVSFNGNAIKTTGKNLVDVADFTMVGASTTQIITLSNFVNILTVGTTYTLSFDAEATGDADVVFDGQPDSIFANKPNALGYDKRITTSTTKQRFSVTGEYLEGTTSFRFYRTTSHTGLNQTINISNIQIEYGSSATDYEPYKTELTSLPVADYFPTGLKSVGVVYDELTSAKYVTRIGSITLDGVNNTFRALMTSSAYGDYGISTFNLVKRDDAKVCVIADGFEGVSFNDRIANINAKRCYCDTGNDIAIRMPVGNTDLGTTTASANTWLQSHPITVYYVLQTPLENYGVFDVKYDIHKGGTEELLPSALLNKEIDLGSLTWTRNTTQTTGVYRFISSAVPNDAVLPSDNDKLANILLPNFTIDTTNHVYQGVASDMSIGLSAQGTLQARADKFEDATAFTNAMQGVKLYYQSTSSVPSTSAFFGDLKIYSQIESLVPYRTFWLVNGNGDRWDFTKHELKSFLNEPQGLGFQKSIDITRYGERAVKNSETYNFPTVSGDLLFYDTPNSTRYEKYNEFVRFLMNQPITLYYQIPVSVYSRIADIYTLKCDVMQLTKTESKTNMMLTSNISLNGMEFYQGEEVVMSGSSPTVTINNNGDFPVGFEIEINGNIKNPYFTLEQNGELYGESKFNDDASNFSSIYVNSKDGEQYVVLKQNNSILPNPLAYQDLSISNGSIYVTFIKLAQGESTLTIGGDSLTLSDYTIRFTPTYRSV